MEIPKAPLTLVENLAYRKEVLRFGYASPENAAGLRAMCRTDPEFYFDTFAWTHDPRLQPSRRPFILYDYQRVALREFLKCFGQYDIKILKSRDMGASWLILSAIAYRWQFSEFAESYLLVSRNEDYVDKRGNPKSLFWKIDFLLEGMPRWILPSYGRTRLNLMNEATGSTIDGESTTGEVARGDRRTAILLDEFAAFELSAGYDALSSTRDATPCRVFLSTPKGTGNAFHAVAENPEIRGIRMHWSEHPTKGKDLYEDNGRKRSPWYDNEVRRCVSPVEVAQELDIDFGASRAVFFDSARLNEIARKYVRRPFHQGEMMRDSPADEWEFRTIRGGKLRLWVNPDANGDIARDRDYAIGVDIATGTGASNSVISVGDRKTGEKVAEYAVANKRPDQLAEVAVSIARWFKGSHGRGAYMCWEAAGPGRIFGDVVVNELNFREVFFRSAEGRISKKHSELLGWYPTRDTKITLFGDYRKNLFSERFINRSIEALDECREIIYSDSGSIEHSRSISTQDPSGAKMNHGDRATADALLNLVMGPRLLRKPETTAVAAGSMAYRQRERTRLARERARW